MFTRELATIDPIAFWQLGRANDLQRDRAIEAGVAGAVDFAHPARTDSHENLERAEA